MAKITSADCIAFARANVPEIAEVPAKEWKRESKVKLPEGIVRSFRGLRPPKTPTVPVRTLVIDVMTKQQRMVITQEPAYPEPVEMYVIERDGKIVEAKMGWYNRPDTAEASAPGLFIFGFGSDRDTKEMLDGFEEGGCLVYINSVKHWRKERCLCDAYTEKESQMLEPILKQTGLSSEMESTYTVLGKTREQLKAELEAAGIRHDLAFEQFCQRGGEG